MPTTDSGKQDRLSRSRWPNGPWSQDSPLTWRQITTYLMAGAAGFTVAGVYFAQLHHEGLEGHPPIVAEVRAFREEVRDTEAKNSAERSKLTHAINTLNLTLKLQGDGTWQRVHEATENADGSP